MVKDNKHNYKYTEEFGYIPNDWEICAIKDTTTIFGRIGFRGYTQADIVKTGYGAISLSPSNINDNKINYDDCTYISWHKYEESPEIKIFDGDVVFVKTGSSYGKNAIIKNLPTKATINPQLIVFKNLKINNVLFYNLLQTNNFIVQLKKIIVGGAIPTLSQKQIGEFKILLPPSPEQEKIAEVLSDVDSLIERTQQLIDKKKNLKIATMQKLVFFRKDVKKNLFVHDLFDLGRGRVISKKEIDNNIGVYPVYSSQTTNNGILGYINTYDFDGEYLTWTTDGANAGQVFYRNGKFNCTNVCGLVKEKNKISCNLYFVMCYLNSVSKKYVSYVGNPKLMNGVFSSIKIRLPKKEEQDKIATILSDMDSEIEKLEQELSKYKDLKIGMMQELLTGKVRLI